MTPERRRSFVLGPCLGRGGYGEVYRATTVSAGGLSAQVALKLVRSEVSVPADARARLRDEARLLARLAHPNIVRVIDLVTVSVGDGAPRLALVTELIEGRDLEVLRRGPEPIGLRAAVEAVACVARALDAAWSETGPDGLPLRVVHRDIKPGNIAIGRHGDVRLLDFGIARFEGEEREAKTATAMLVGSLPYLAPERFLEREAQPSADVFGLGCVLFECAVGERWYEPIPTRAIPALATDRDRYEAWRWERLMGAGLPPPLQRILADALVWSVAERVTSSELATRLEALELPGPSLRAFCRERAWPDPDPLPGSLEGRTVVEVPEPGAPAPVAPPLAPLDLKIAQRAQPTIDPGADVAVPIDAGPRGRVAPVVATGLVGVAPLPDRVAPPAQSPVSAAPPAPRAGRWRWLALGCLGAALLAFATGGGVIVAGLLGGLAWFA